MKININKWKRGKIVKLEEMGKKVLNCLEKQ